jgi:ADP-ribose pyrophosphatase YjhB (NUDIX family)
VIDRTAVRAVIVDDDGSVLLLRVTEPASGKVFWICPGGGVDEGEDAETAIRRELAEEVGLVDCEVGPVVWAGVKEFAWAGVEYRQHESYYRVRCPRFDPRTGPGHPEAEVFDEARWWDAAGLAASGETYEPQTLVDIVGAVPVPPASHPPTHPFVRRRAVRGLIVDDDERVLLVKVTAGDGWTGWICPGGGVEPGEDDAAALTRELAEEVGMSEPLSAEYVSTWEPEPGHLHRIYLVRCAAFDPVQGDGHPADEVFDDVRWWPISELATSAERTGPHDLATVALRLLRAPVEDA